MVETCESLKKAQFDKKHSDGSIKSWYTKQENLRTTNIISSCITQLGDFDNYVLRSRGEYQQSITCCWNNRLAEWKVML